MANGRDSDDTLRENPLVTQFIARGAETAMILPGFIGPAAREGHVRVYPRLQNLSDSIEIARQDILHSVEAPQSALGAVMLWVNNDAKISIHRVGVSEPIGSQVEKLGIQGPVSPQHENFVDLRKGRRETTQNRRVFRAAVDLLCFSHCMTAFLCEVA